MYGPTNTEVDTGYGRHLGHEAGGIAVSQGFFCAGCKEVNILQVTYDAMKASDHEVISWRPGGHVMN